MLADLSLEAGEMDNAQRYLERSLRLKESLGNLKEYLEQGAEPRLPARGIPPH